MIYENKFCSVLFCSGTENDDVAIVEGELAVASSPVLLDREIGLSTPVALLTSLLRG